METAVDQVLLIDASPSALADTQRPITDAGVKCLLARSIDAAAVVIPTTRLLMVFIESQTLGNDERKVQQAVMRLRQLTRIPIVVIVSEGTSAEVVESLWRAGVDDLILRPVRLKQVLTRLTAVCAPPAAVRVERRNTRVCLFLSSDEAIRQAVGGLLELEGFQLLYCADEMAVARLSATERIDCVVLAAERPDREVNALLARLTARRPELDEVPTVLIAANLPLVPPVKKQLWLAWGHSAPERAVRALQDFLKKSTTALLAQTRVPFFCLVEFRDTPPSSEIWNPSFSFDLSPAGLFLKTLAPARPGTTLEFRLHLTTTGEKMLGSGVVAWANTFADRRAFTCPVGMGLQFLGMSPKPLARLREMCRLATQMS